MIESELNMIIPANVGILVAGIASGIVGFLLLGSFRKGKGSKYGTNGRNVDDSRCACCLKPFLVGRGVECNDCGAKSCRKACCRWDSIDDAWFCLFCYHSRSRSRRKEKWFETFGGLPVENETSKNFSTAKSRVYDEGAEDVAIHSELDLAVGGRKEGDSMETVREFVEKIVESIVGNVDDTPIDRLYDHPAYKPGTDTPSVAHNALRELMERAVEEARKLPGLGATVSTGIQEDSSFSELSYEDLLSTAILNKVIEKCQKDRIDGNSNVLHRRPRSNQAIRDNEVGLDEGVEEGSSSLEPLSQDECSNEENLQQPRNFLVRREPMSLTIEERIEEVTTTFTSDEELQCTKTNELEFRNARRVPFPEFGMDIVDPSQESSDESEEDDNASNHVDVMTSIESWEENWLFQKRKIQTQSEPVAMLVPNPNSDFRALIGDKDAEDTSDLSEFSAQSEDEIEDEELVETINETLPHLSKSQKISTDLSDNICDTVKPRQWSQDVPNSLDTETGKKIDHRLEADVNNDFKTVFLDTNINNNAEVFTKSEQSDENCNKTNIGVLENCSKTEQCLSNNKELSETLVSSPSTISTSESVEEVSTGCDNRQLNEKLLITDKTVERTQSNEETVVLPSKTSNGAEQSLELSEINECLIKNTERDKDCDRSEVKTIDQCNGIAKKPVEDSTREDEKMNGEEENIKDKTSSFKKTDRRCQALAEAKADSASEKSNRVINADVGLATPPRPGTIAEREHKKWENAAPIENNPYSEENIQKRLLERQYARRSSDVSGNATLQTCPSPPLQIVLRAVRPDFKRFRRDYYINEAKFPNGQSTGEPGFFTTTSRPSSSLSQHSLSTGSDYEQQERSRSVDTDSTCSTSSESKRKIATDSQQNNVQSALRRGSVPLGGYKEAMDTQPGDLRNDERRQSLNDVSRDNNWNGEESFDEILERDRKNSKNEINAKLNNRGNFDENQKPIRRIDLRAYGFENEFNVKIRDNANTKEPKRVVNKLDLRSFGYDSGLRRTQSNNNIDRRTNNGILNTRTNFIKLEGKSNLLERNDDRRFSALPSFPSFEGSSDGDFMKSTEALNDDAAIDYQKFGRISSAKSVPNIGELYSRIGEETARENRSEVDEISEILRIKSISTEEDNNCAMNGSFASKDTDETDGGQEMNAGNNLPMPSVKRLAQAFNKSEGTTSLQTRRPSKPIVNPTSKERPTTPEVHIVDTPRQMHSLTARSLPREFREGLRLLSSKPTISCGKVTTEQSRLPEMSPATNQIGSSEDVSVIAPGKLKNNIQFWEQLHRKS